MRGPFDFDHEPDPEDGDTGFRLVAIVLALAVMLAALAALPACGEPLATRIVEAATQSPPAPPPTTVGEADHRLADANARAAAADREAIAAHGEVRIITAERDQLAISAGKVRLAWAAGVLLMAGIGFGILVFVLPAGCRGWATMAAVGCTFGACLAMVLRVVYAWLPLAGAGGGAAFILYAGWQLWQHRKAAAEAGQHGDRLESVVKAYLPEKADELLTLVKQKSAETQAAAGVGALLAAIRGKRHKPPTAT